MRKGSKVSEETRKRIAEKVKQLWQNPEYREKQVEHLRYTMKGKKHTEEARKKMSENNWSKKPTTDEIRKKLSEKLEGNKNAVGTKHSEKKNISKEVLLELYVQKGHTVKEVANILNVKSITVHRRLVEHNIPRHSRLYGRMRKGCWWNQETKEKIAKKAKERWEDQEFRKRVIPIIKASGACFKKGSIPWNKGMEGFMAGEKNGRWRGGREPYYGSNWSHQSKLARERDDFKCQKCGVPQNGTTHNVHHLVSFREFGRERYKEANDLSNLITLCSSCHQIVENGGSIYV